MQPTSHKPSLFSRRTFFAALGLLFTFEIVSRYFSTPQTESAQPAEAPPTRRPQNSTTYYVSLNGTPSGSGKRDSPFDLRTALERADLNTPARLLLLDTEYTIDAPLESRNGDMEIAHVAGEQVTIRLNSRLTLNGGSVMWKGVAIRG